VFLNPGFEGMNIKRAVRESYFRIIEQENFVEDFSIIEVDY
jgi:hypothetical protein